MVSTNIETIFSNNIDMNCICVKTWNQSDSDTMWINMVSQNLRKIEREKIKLLKIADKFPETTSISKFV